MQIDSTKSVCYLEVLPRDLQEANQWVCWRYAERNKPDTKSAKIPLNPTTGRPADVTKPDDWTGSVTAALYYHDVGETETAGIGFVFTSDDPFVGIDLDDCITAPGKLEPWACDIVETVNCYTEYSPSGTGVHCLCKGTLPAGNARSERIELYEEDRFFTVTAAPIPTLTSPQQTVDRTPELAAVYDRYFEEAPTQHSTAQQPAVTTGGGGNHLSDDEVLAKAQNAANAQKFERLWAGSTRGYPSHSEADLALCCLLAFWTGGDAQQIDRLFRQSGLYRPKWDAKRGKRTYGKLTIATALDKTDDFYDIP